MSVLVKINENYENTMVLCKVETKLASFFPKILKSLHQEKKVPGCSAFTSILSQNFSFVAVTKGAPNRIIERSTHVLIDRKVVPMGLKEKVVELYLRPPCYHTTKSKVIASYSNMSV